MDGVDAAVVRGLMDAVPVVDLPLGRISVLALVVAAVVVFAVAVLAWVLLAVRKARRVPPTVHLWPHGMSGEQQRHLRAARLAAQQLVDGWGDLPGSSRPGAGDGLRGPVWPGRVPAPWQELKPDRDPLPLPLQDPWSGR